jgi:hypothetical protein
MNWGTLPYAMISYFSLTAIESFSLHLTVVCKKTSAVYLKICLCCTEQWLLPNMCLLFVFLAKKKCHVHTFTPLNFSFHMSAFFVFHCFHIAYEPWLYFVQNRLCIFLYQNRLYFIPPLFLLFAKVMWWECCYIFACDDSLLHVLFCFC